MASKRAIKLFDIRSTLTPQAWSPHVWRTRFVLNYKRLPHATEWVPYPDLNKVLSKIGAPPTRTKEPPYTVPVIIDAIANPPVVLSDSTTIADHLERAYPKPTIYPYGRQVQMSYVAKIGELAVGPMAYLVAPNTMRILPEGRDVKYYVSTRKNMFGVDLKDMLNPGNEAERWEGLKNSLSKLSTLTDKTAHGDRWLFGTAQGPGYADFALGAAFIWFQSAGPEGGWEKLRRLDGGKWEKFCEDMREYMQVI